jgi:hypothetical protein
MLCKCGNDISDQRFDLGFKSCLECGQADALSEIEKKSGRVAVAYSKGPLMYMGAPDVAKANLQGTMNAQGRSIATLLGGSILDGKSVEDRIVGKLDIVGTITGRLPVRDPKTSNPPRSPTGRLANRQPEMQELKPRRKMIGVAYMLNGDKYALYSRHDPILAKATRHTFFEDGAC